LSKRLAVNSDTDHTLSFRKKLEEDHGYTNTDFYCVKYKCGWFIQYAKHWTSTAVKQIETKY